MKDNRAASSIIDKKTLQECIDMLQMLSQIYMLLGFPEGIPKIAILIDKLSK